LLFVAANAMEDARACCKRTCFQGIKKAAEFYGRGLLEFFILMRIE
jgi:hypothetical protein